VTQKWFTLMTWNIAHLNATGVRTWATRRGSVVRKIKSVAPDVFCSQENVKTVGKLSGYEYVDAHLTGYKRVSGADGRYIYIRTATVQYITGGVFQLKPEYRNDDKQAAWAILQMKNGGEKFLVTSYHLENEGYEDTIRYKQMKSCMSQAKVEAHTRGIPDSRIFHAGDTNFQTTGAINKVKSLGYADAFDKAKKAQKKGYRSFNDWRATRLGFRIDRVWIDPSRPVLLAKQFVSLIRAADHNAQVVVVGKSS
jgi:endonuclease/exonuclease/phosphatase family metal-dependent hydrolase